MNTIIKSSGEGAEKLYKESSLNCAQSIYRYFQDHASVSEETILDARAYGGGRAEEGLCGALYAALNIKNLKAAQKEEMKALFSDYTGSIKCREIKSLKRVKCSECVKKAAELLSDNC